MTNAIDARAAIAEWFETDFKDSAKATTKTSRLEDGRLSYSFSVVNDSGFDFDKFSFKIKESGQAVRRRISNQSCPSLPVSVTCPL